MRYHTYDKRICGCTSLSHWHTLSPEASLQKLDSHTGGLDSESVKIKRREYGSNELQAATIKSPWLIFWEQISSIMVVILLVAAGLSALLGDFQDAGVILAIVIFFVTLGVVQEYRAEQAIAALKQLAVPDVRVRREQQTQLIPAPELVPGDILLLEAGDQIPADARLLETHTFKVQEAALTGESEAVEKQINALTEEASVLGDKTNMVFMGTAATYGRAEAVVVTTGMQTELGHIAHLIQNAEQRRTPLQKRLDEVGKTLAIVAIACSALIFLVGLLQHEELKLMIMSAISVAVAAVPEGLPAVLTITLAFGSQRMLKRHALVRKLTGIETLGSVSVICSDKTGTLTQNQMTVTQLWTQQKMLNIEADRLPDLNADSALLLLCGLLCNDSEIQAEQEMGDPTELALLHAVQKYKWSFSELLETLPRLQERPFDSERKRMTTLHQWPKQTENFPPELAQAFQSLPQQSCLVFVKGSIDSLLEKADKILVNGQWLALDENRLQDLEKANQTLASEGRRVLGFALRTLSELPDSHTEIEEHLGIIGLMAMMDPPRPEAQEAIKICQSAGIRPIMITGDHPLTALKIAQELGITKNNLVLTGLEMQHLNQEQLQEKLRDISVFARVSPEHKLLIVTALQAQNRIVAMTGDGVNDAPALKQADIGVAMGITGTDVSKEAADMVLQDDNFATIVAAIEEGRTIYDNLRKFIKFSVAGNLGKILAMLIAPIFGMPLALLPIQMLWLNLLTDGLLGFGLGLENAEKNSMKRPPTSPDEGIFGGGMMLQIIWMGLLISAISMGLAAYYWYAKGPDSAWQTVLFTSLAFAQIFQALGIRSSQDSLLEMGLFSNRVLTAMVAAVLLLQAAVVYIPWLNTLFHTQALGSLDILVIAISNVLILAVAEALKSSGQSV